MPISQLVDKCPSPALEEYNVVDGMRVDYQVNHATAVEW